MFRKRTIRSRGRPFVVHRGVFDPQRHLSGLAFADVLPELAASRLPEKAKVLDLGTGCGVLAAALSEVAHIVVATDVNPKAVADAERNLRHCGAEVRGGDLFEPVWGEWFDLVVVNPPYEIGIGDDPALISPDVVERFGAEVGGYTDRALVGWPAQDAATLSEVSGIDLERVMVVPTEGEPLGIFEWSRVRAD